MNLTTNQRADLNKKIDAAEKESEKFLAEIGYSNSKGDSGSKAGMTVDDVFLEAMKRYLTDSKEDIWALAYVASELEADPGIHEVKFVNEIYLAIDLQFYLLNLKDRNVKKNVWALKEFFNNMNIK